MPEPIAPDRANGTASGVVGTRQLVSFTVSALSPVASVFISGAGVLQLAGTGTAPGLVFGVMIALLVALIYAELASHVPHAGGVYPGIRAALGPAAGFLVMGMALLTAPAYIAFAAQGFGAAMRAALPGMPIALAGMVAVLLATGIALLRLRTSLTVAAMLLAGELVAVAVLAAASLHEPARTVATAMLHPARFADGGWLPLDAPRLVVAIVGGAFACSGALWGTYLGEERSGEPAAFGRGLVLSAVVGAGLVAVPLLLASLAVTAADLGDPAGPLLALIRRAAGPALTAVCGLAIAVAIFNNLLTMLVAFSRLMVASARERLWPAPVAGLLRRHATSTGAPVAATILLAAIALPLLLVDNQRLLVVLSAEALTPLLAACAVLVGRRRLAARSTGVRMPGHPVLPALTLLIGLIVVYAEWNDPGAGRPGMMVMAGATVVLMLLYLARGDRRAPIACPNE